MSHEADNTQRTYAIWTVAGIMILSALVFGLTHNKQNSTTEPTPADIIQPVAVVKAQTAPRLDVAFTIDATGSMGDEIEVVKKEIWSIANKLMQGDPAPDIRFGLVFYQDRGDSFLVKKTELTRDVESIRKELMAISAGGGGDWREHVGRGLHETLQMEWDNSPNTTRLVYLVGDAPGHDDYNDGYSIASAIDMAKNKDIKINVIGCSGLDAGREEFKSIAQSSGGKYTELTYEAVVADQNGVRKSVIHYNGQVYEAPKVLEKSDWGRGADKLINEGRLKPASGYVRKRAAAPGAKTMNNLDDVFFGGVKEEAEAKGVLYK